jgi:YhgE/Pip-like protein
MSTVIATSTTSFYVGRQVQQKTFLTEKQQQGKESTKIAVVNQDQGTSYKEKKVNYALDFFKSLDNGYEITDREAAQKGIESGKYGAMIVTPGNFSKNITSINELTPSKVKIYYQPNDKLTKENKLVVSGKISEFEKKLNSKLSYMYLSGIFDELHNGQDDASDILKDDTTDLETINSINDSDILASIKLTTLENKDIKFSNLDLNKDFDENRKAIDEVDKKYRTKMISKESELDGIEKEFVDVLTNKDAGVKTFSDRLREMDKDQVADKFSGKYKYNYSGLTNNYDVNVSDVNSYLEDLTKDKGKIDGLVDEYEKQTLLKVNEKGSSAIKKSDEKLKDIQEKADSNSDIIKNNAISGLDNLKKDIKSQNDPKTQSLNEEYILYGQMISKLKESNPEVFEDVYNQVVKSNDIDYSKILKDPLVDSKNDNSFKDSNELKEYIGKGIDDKNGNFITSRSSNYKNVDENDENVKSISDIISNLNKANTNSGKISSSAKYIMDDEDYKYLQNIFSENKDKPLGESLKIKDSLIDPIKASVDGANKKQLISTIKTNNTKNVDSIKQTIQKEAEKVVENVGPIKFKDVVDAFDKDYMTQFHSIITYADSLGKTPVKVEDDKEIFELLEKYDKSNGNINDKVTKKIDEYNKVEDEVKKQSNDHVTSMMGDLNKGIEESKNKLASGLKNAKTMKEKTSDSNKERLDSLVSVLSNSRLGTVENSDLYRFITSPVFVVQNKSLEGNIVKSQQNDRNEVEKIVVSILVAYSMLWLARVIYKRKIKVKLNLNK